MKESYYKLKTTLYSDGDNAISNVVMFEYDTKKKREILTTPVWTKKGYGYNALIMMRVICYQVVLPQKKKHKQN